jgi:hypothetical protein
MTSLGDRRRPMGRRNRHELEGRDRLRRAVLDDLEVSLRQARDRTVVCVGDDSVELHVLDAGPEGRLLRRGQPQRNACDRQHRIRNPARHRGGSIGPEAFMSVIKAGMAAGLVIVAGALASARQAQPAAQPDVLPALLEEVRGLRAAMEQMASAGPRIQLFTSRLQLQEARINNLIHRLDGVRGSREGAERELADIQERQRQAEQALSDGTGPISRDDLAAVISHAKREVTDRKLTVARFAAEENQLTGDIATEQARWTDINSRLDDLEKALSSRR